MKRAAAIAAIALSCAPAAAPSVSLQAMSSATPSATSEPPIASASASAEAILPPLGPEVLYEGARAARLARMTGIARGIFDAFANVTPQPVTRGFAQIQFVQWSTDRRERGSFSWVEASTTAFHGAPDVAEHVEPCALPIPFGEETRLSRGLVKLVRRADHDELLVSDGKAPLAPARLPRGVSHGACAGPDGSRAWISWSTPETPAEISSVSLRDGATRPLRIDARPGLAALGDMKSEAFTLEKPGDAAILEPVTAPKRSAILVTTRDEPLAAWDPLARFLVEASVGVLVTRTVDARAIGAAEKRWGGTPIVIATSLPAALPEGARLVVVSKRDTLEQATAWPRGTMLIALGPGAREALVSSRAARESGVTWTLAEGPTARVSEPVAWAKVADAVLEAP